VDRLRRLQSVSSPQVIERWLPERTQALPTRRTAREPPWPDPRATLDQHVNVPVSKYRKASSNECRFSSQRNCRNTRARKMPELVVSESVTDLDGTEAGEIEN
jgi:hypothetical protein